MNARQLVAGHGEHAEGVVVAQVGFHGEGEFRQIAQVVQIVGVDPCGIKALTVERHIRIGVVQGFFQPLQLQGADFIAAGKLDRVKR